MKASDSFVLLLGALLLFTIAILLTVGRDDHHVAYCARGGHVTWQPDSSDQHYTVKCVRTRP